MYSRVTGEIKIIDKLIMHSWLSHTFGQCDMCFVELQWYVSSNGNSTYSASSRAHTCSKKNFQDLCFLKLVQDDFAGNKRGERMNRSLDYAIVQLKPVSWSKFPRLLKRLGILEPRRSHKMFLKCWLYRFLWMLPSLKFMSSFSWVCIFLLWFAIPCALALYANLFSVTNRQVYSPLIKDSQK